MIENSNQAKLAQKTDERIAPEMVREASREETRQAVWAVVNLAIFILFWGGTSVWAVFTEFSGWVKLGIMVVSFPVWGLIVNRVFIRLTHKQP